MLGTLLKNRRIIVISLIVFVQQIVAKDAVRQKDNIRDSARKSLDKQADNLIERLFKARALTNTDLDDGTLGKGPQPSLAQLEVHFSAWSSHCSKVHCRQSSVHRFDRSDHYLAGTVNFQRSAQAIFGRGASVGADKSSSLRSSHFASPFAPSFSPAFSPFFPSVSRNHRLPSNFAVPGSPCASTVAAANDPCVEFVLDRIYKSVFGGVDPTEEVMLKFTDRMNSSTSFASSTIRTTDGAFVIRAHNVYDAEGAPEGRFLSGYDGLDTVWLWDHIAKQRRELELDEKEQAILSSWVELALYALPRIRDKLSITHLTPEAAKHMGAQVGEVCLAMRIRESESLHVDGCVTVYQFVNIKTWLPTKTLTLFCGKCRTTELLDWQPSQAVPSMIFATTAVSRDENEYKRKIWSVRPHGGQSVPYGPSASRLIGLHMAHRAPALQAILQGAPDIPGEAPAAICDQCPDESTWEPDEERLFTGPKAGYNDTTFDVTVGNEVKMVRNSQRHMLLPGLINGQDVGLWMIDTGASSNVVDARVAQELGLSNFGEFNEPVLGGVATSAQVNVANFMVGPMTVTNSIFTVLDLKALFSQAGPKIAGIVGYDFFSRVILDIRFDNRVFMYDPQSIDLESLEVPGNSSGGVVYAPIKFVMKTAHIEATVKAGCQAPPMTNLMLLDLGAGGPQMMLNKKKAEKAGLFEDTSKLNPSRKLLYGVGGNSPGFKSWRCPVEYVDIGSLRLDGHAGKNLTAGIFDCPTDLSNLSNGVLCVQLFEDCDVVLDYPRKRFGVARCRTKETKDIAQQVLSIFESVK